MSLFSPLLDNDSRSECHKFTSMDQLPIVAPTKIIRRKTSPRVSEIMSHLYQGLDPKEQIYQLFLKWFEMSEIEDYTYDTLMKAAGTLKHACWPITSKRKQEWRKTKPLICPLPHWKAYNNIDHYMYQSHQLSVINKLQLGLTIMNYNCTCILIKLKKCSN